jgi:hypothetical protein
MATEAKARSSRRRSKAAAGLAVCAVAALSSALVSATTASATPTPLPDKIVNTVTDDGWSLDLAATELSANPVPNLATTAFTREGFVSAKVTGTITGSGDSAIKTGYVEQGLQVGCQVDVSSGLAVGLGFSLGPSVGVSISGVPSVNLGVNASVNPSIQTTIAPGTITTIPLGKKDLEAAKASITVARSPFVRTPSCRYRRQRRTTRCSCTPTRPGSDSSTARHLACSHLHR